MEAKRIAMQNNAKERDREREANVKRYKEEELKEVEADNLKTLQPGFVKPMMMEHAENTSVEDRIKRNIYNIQRTNAALEKKFTQH
ncbi:hypothetical protein CAPTEDRAFT_158662 [Capitella teleta]|uniref:Uncharacterized protein n=1 Tax=Capitella teleta TaxID=283909 RepID=R7TI31_CAPTE|nr:hypothetical protein CAPTEDRAFT_158662 [Capitella teleta]|eukprot:ELT93488.1 hypothetical protein CAPTEDRAFT_158662 [Capitella teleta]